MENQEAKTQEEKRAEELNTYLGIVKGNKLEMLFMFSEMMESFLLNSDDTTRGTTDKVQLKNFSDTMKKIIVNA